MSLDSFTPFQGYFWLPRSPEIKVPGRCHVADDGRMELSVLGTLTGRPIEPMEVDVSRVYGITERGRAVTLDGCMYRSRNFHIPGIAVGDIHVALLLVGHHFGAAEPLVFEEIAFHADALDVWLEFAPIRSRWSAEPSRSATISFTPPKPKEWVLPSGLRVRLETRWSAPAAISLREAKIAQTTWVSLIAPEPCGLADLRELLGRFMNFVTLVLDQPLAPRGIEVYNNALLERIGKQERPAAIGVHYASTKHDPVDLTRVSAPFPLLRFGDIRERLDQVLGNWFENYERFAAPFNLYFAATGGNDLFLENRFLMLVHALEALHRHTSTERALGDEQYADLSACLRAAVPRQHSKWLETRLAYGNELSLRKRLKQLFRGFTAVFGGARIVSGLIDRVVNTRNYLTHYDSKSGDNHPDVHYLHELCYALECIMQLQLALNCGLSPDEVLAAVGRSELFEARLRRAKEILVTRFGRRVN